MILGTVIAGVGEVASAFLSGDGRQDVADGGADSLGGSLGGSAQQVLELGEEPLDGVQVGEYFGRKKSLAPADRMASMITMSPG